MKQLKIQSLVDKIKQDLEKGVKILGNYANQSDVIRVWTRLGDVEFGIVATSSGRFNRKGDLVEIQAFFSDKSGIKMSILHMKDDFEVNFERLGKNFTKDEGRFPEVDEMKEFVQKYLQSKPDEGLTKKYFERNARHSSQVEWQDKMKIG